MVLGPTSSPQTLQPDVSQPSSDPSSAERDGDGVASSPQVSRSQAGVAAPEDETLALIPVRMLNEFTYCPRLGYLEWVQGEWAENLETLEGTFGHRNVDKPDRKMIAAPAGDDAAGRPADDVEDARGTEAQEADDRIHARSLTLSAPQEGLIAKLDLLEIEASRATPVDYKRGQVPDTPGGAYDPERVQLCAQGLILRENGFECTEGVLYFVASKRRVVVLFDEELIALTRQQVVRFRENAADGVCPPPLVDSPKCPRCSLVTICLPDETNFLREISPDDSSERDSSLRTDRKPSKDGLRRLLPARDDALPLYVQEFGAYVGKEGDRLVVSKKREKLASVRLIDVSQVCLLGNVTLSSPALKELTVRGIPICHFTYGGWFHGITTGLAHNNVELRIRQYQIADDPRQSLPLAKAFITGKIKNCRTLLRRHLGDRKAPVLRQLNEYHQRVQKVESAASLLGLEGMAAKDYFAAYFTLLAGQPEFDVNGRNRRPPRDPVNAVLSFVYSLLTKEFTITLQSVGFDSMRGFLHQPRFSRPSLALDLAEEFRPLIADSVALMVFNNGEVDRSAFIERAGAVTLTQAGRRSVLAAFERRLQTEITHPLFGYKISYRRILEVQARLLARTVMHELHEYPNFCTR